MKDLGLQRGYVVVFAGEPHEIRRGMSGLAELLQALGLRPGSKR